VRGARKDAAWGSYNKMTVALEDLNSFLVAFADVRLGSLGR